MMRVMLLGVFWFKVLVGWAIHHMPESIKSASVAWAIKALFTLVPSYKATLHSQKITKISYQVRAYS